MPTKNRGHCNWYVAEFDGHDTFFGYANLGNPAFAEWGYISFLELREARIQVPWEDAITGLVIGRITMQIEHDTHWKPCPFSTIPSTT